MGSGERGESEQQSVNLGVNSRGVGGESSGRELAVEARVGCVASGEGGGVIAHASGAAPAGVGALSGLDRLPGVEHWRTNGLVLGSEERGGRVRGSEARCCDGEGVAGPGVDVGSPGGSS